MAYNGKNYCRITWNKIDGAAGYYIWAKYDGGTYALIETISSGDTLQYVHDDTNTTAPTFDKNKIMWYRVQAFSSYEGYTTESTWSSGVKKAKK